jgi:hypothetical protein
VYYINIKDEDFRIITFSLVAIFLTLNLLYHIKKAPEEAVSKWKKKKAY